MGSRKKRAKLPLDKGSILMVAAALWLGYRALTAPGELTQLAGIGQSSPQIVKSADPANPANSKDPVNQLIQQTTALQGKISEETAALEDLGNADGISRGPAGHTPTVAFNLLTPHCPSLDTVKSNVWIEIDEMGHILSLEPDSKGAPPNLGSCEFEPYRGPHGRPLSVRTHYIVSK